MAKTFEDWKREYYPIPAHYVADERDAAAHSLKKWEGLRPEVLAEHDMVQDERGLYQPNHGYAVPVALMLVDGKSCALCRHHIMHPEKEGCETCPLYQVLGRACDSGFHSPYKIFLRTGDPEPMIAALRLAVEKSKS